MRPAPPILRESLEQEVTRQREQLRAQHEREQLYARAARSGEQEAPPHSSGYARWTGGPVGGVAVVRAHQWQAGSRGAGGSTCAKFCAAIWTSLSSEAGDLSTALAQFRYLHEARLCRMGLRLDWQVQLLPDLVWRLSGTHAT